LRAGGEEFLSRAFRATGAIGADNRVTAVTQLQEIAGGSTGRKLLLGVAYEKSAPELYTELFVKFSRDFDDDVRDRARTQMEREVSFALLSRDPAFPIAVPVCYFSDYHADSGTGILITQRIAFGHGDIEPHYPKALDHRMPDPLGHYRAIVTALGRLAGTHKAGRLPDTVERYFPFDPRELSVARRAPYTPEQIGSRVARYAAFCRTHPQLLPEAIRSVDFLARLADQAPRFQVMAAAGYRMLQSAQDLIALCHWNAHVDNAWFWRGPGGLLQCGLIDWGNVSQMNLAMPIWGCLSAAEPWIWQAHLHELLALFASEFARCGAPALDLDRLQLHLRVYVGLMGLGWMLDAVPLIQAEVPDLTSAESRLDERIQRSERARTLLLILMVFLSLWQQSDMEQVIDAMATFR
jgi:hypothetical protein